MLDSCHAEIVHELSIPLAKVACQ